MKLKEALATAVAGVMLTAGLVAAMAGAATAAVVDDSCRIQNNANDNQVDCDFEGEATSTADQSGSANSGDGVGGQVIGVVTSAGGSADLVLAIYSEQVTVGTGNAQTANAAAIVAEAFVA